MTQVNSTRKNLIDHLENEVSFRKKQLHDACNEMRRKNTDVIRSYNDYQAAISNNLDPAEIDRLLSQKQSLAKSW